jgi:hypothetical protein
MPPWHGTSGRLVSGKFLVCYRLAGLKGGQRRYLSEKAGSRLRGHKVCLTTIAPALLVRVPAERVVAFLLDHCQVGLAVMSIIVEFSFFLASG